MNTYEFLISGIKRYGSNGEEICESNFKCKSSEIREKVIVAPTWEVNIFSDHVDNIKHIAGAKKHENVVSELTLGGNKITFITSNIGASRVFDTVLALKSTPCKEILFVGSVGALDGSLKIGDIVIPEYSISGVGVDRYLTSENVFENDCYGQKYYPSKKFSDKVWKNANEMIKNTDIELHIGRTFSVDTIFAQYAHLEEFISMGCNTIEMETAAFFHTADIVGIEAAAILSVIDNTVGGKSLYNSGRTDKDRKLIKELRKTLMPKMVLDVLMK